MSMRVKRARERDRDSDSGRKKDRGRGADRGRFDGVDPRGRRPALLKKGDYICEFLSLAPGEITDTYILRLRVAEVVKGKAHAEGDEVCHIFHWSPRARVVSAARMVQLAIALAGYDPEEELAEYREYDPHNKLLDALTEGVDNGFAEDAEALEGSLVGVLAERGNDREEEDGSTGYWTDPTFYPIDDDD